jgi:BAR domain of APPL family
MVIGIAPLAALEFTDCLLDTPDFRENLNRHEKELEKTSQQIKRIIKEVKDLLSAAKSKFSNILQYVYCIMPTIDKHTKPHSLAFT